VYEKTDTLTVESSIGFRVIKSGEFTRLESKSIGKYSSVIWREKPSKDTIYFEISKQIDQWLKE